MPSTFCGIGYSHETKISMAVRRRDEGTVLDESFSFVP